MSRILTDVVSALYRSEINAGLQSVYDLGINVWLGNDQLEPVEIKNFSFDTLNDAGEWLHQVAIRHYPNSRYAREA